jgi:hypothetical protein
MKMADVCRFSQWGLNGGQGAMRQLLEKIGRRRKAGGWNLAMQMRVAAARLRVVEVPVGQRRRAGGVSKVSGNWWVATRVAGVLAVIFLRLALQLRAARPEQSKSHERASNSFILKACDCLRAARTN